MGKSQNVKVDSLKSLPEVKVAGDTSLIAQVDSTVKAKKIKFIPDPKTATRLALIPGGGQIYNRDYWKLPFIYLSLGGGIYTYHLNTLKYNDFLKAYESFYDMDKKSATYGQLLPGYTVEKRMPVKVRNLLNTKSEVVDATKDGIERQKNYWRRNRNLAIIVSGLIYTLTIIEANVAAHLKGFDLSDDLTLQVAPKVSQPMMMEPTPGVRLVFNFKK